MPYGVVAYQLCSRAACTTSDVIENDGSATSSAGTAPEVRVDTGTSRVQPSDEAKDSRTRGNLSSGSPKKDDLGHTGDRATTHPVPPASWVTSGKSSSADGCVPGMRGSRAPTTQRGVLVATTRRSPLTTTASTDVDWSTPTKRRSISATTRSAPTTPTKRSSTWTGTVVVTM